MAADMVTVNGVRYRAEDAKRLGLVPGSDDEPEPKARTPKNKARTPKNKVAEPAGSDADEES